MTGISLAVSLPKVLSHTPHFSGKKMKLIYEFIHELEIYLHLNSP